MDPHLNMLPIPSFWLTPTVSRIWFWELPFLIERVVWRRFKTKARKLFTGMLCGWTWCQQKFWLSASFTTGRSYFRDETAIVLSLQSSDKQGLYDCSGSNAVHPEISPSWHRHCPIATTQYGTCKSIGDPSAKTSMDSGLPDSNSAEVEKLDSSPFGNILNWAVKEDWTRQVYPFISQGEATTTN